MGLMRASDRISRPRYLDQDDKILLQKFRNIRHQEDARIRDAALNPEDSDWTFGVSALYYNVSRNRYSNIKTYEKTRVKLAVTKGNDYINASHVEIYIPGQSRKKSRYIASQGPMHNTWQQFWQMIYHECPEREISVVMVTPLEEDGREKCYPYWPMSTSDPMVSPRVQKTGSQQEDCSEFPFEILLETVLSQSFNHYVLTKIQLKPIGTSDPVKIVNHFYYDQWQDMDRPNEIIPLHHLMKHVRSASSPDNPIIIQCSAGVGRTGTYIALDHLLLHTSDFIQEEFIHDYEKDLPEEIVLQMRSQRLKTVQSPQQYLFIYHAAKMIFRYIKGL